jgi:hypothetical protein
LAGVRHAALGGRRVFGMTAWKNYVEQKQVLFGKLRSDCSLSKTSTNSM